MDNDLDIHNSQVSSSGLIIFFPLKKAQNNIVIKDFFVPGVSPLLKGLSVILSEPPYKDD